MSEPGKSDRWNSLLESLGVPVSPPASSPPSESPAASNPPAAKAQPVSMLPPQKQKATPKPKSGPPAAKSPSYWSRIAGALGLETPSAPEPAALAEPKPKVEHQGEPPAESLDEMRRETPPEAGEPTHHPAPQRRERERPSRSFERHREERRPRHERPPREERTRPEPETASGQPASALDEMFGFKSPDVDVFSLGESSSPRVREPGGADIDKDDDRGSVLDYDLPREGGSDLALDKTAGRGAGFESEGGEGGGPRRRRRRRGRGRRGGASRQPAPRAHDADIEPAGEEADFDFDRDEELELELEGAEGPAAERVAEKPGGWGEREDNFEDYPPAGDRGPRGRDEQRGGRRGRRRDRDRERPADRAGRREPEVQRGGPGRSEPADIAPAAHEDFDEDLSSEVDDGSEDRGDLPTHKKIPTWDEAVGMLIEANMANRGPERDRDRGYGRGRGGRGRG